jgi:cysteinyl-tRNA synthetase
MSEALLGLPFDIHTGGIDHREIHHPNEIAQNQAHGCASDSGARIWMHNNFLVERSGKMSKSSGEFLRLQLLIDKGFHPLAYRLMCLQAHYRSELEFSWEGLAAALVRLKRVVIVMRNHIGSVDTEEFEDTRDKIVASLRAEPTDALREFDQAIFDDLNTPLALVALEKAIGLNTRGAGWVREALGQAAMMDSVLGLNLLTLSRTDLRIRPKSAQITEAEIEAALTQRKDARAAKDYAASDRIRDDLIAKGVEVMDGDPLGWDWRIEL